MKITIQCILAFCIFLSACQSDKKNNKIISLVADFETEPVFSSGDAADDIAILNHPNIKDGSIIIATDKKRGLEIYNTKGEKIYDYPIGRVNNVDLRKGFYLGGKKHTLVMSTNRTDNTITAHILQEKSGILMDVQARPLKSNLKKIYGFAMYKSKTGKMYAFCSGKSGKIEQWEIFEQDKKVDGKILRTFEVGSQTEGMAADDSYGKIYIAEENKGLWCYDAEPNSKTKRKKIISVDAPNMAADFEGVTIYKTNEKKGFVILSSQGNNSYAVFDRITNQYLGSFRLIDGNEIDGTSDTDGIDVSSSFGSEHPKGILIAQDGANTENKDTLHQNFKIIDWRKIVKALNLK